MRGLIFLCIFIFALSFLDVVQAGSTPKFFDNNNGSYVGGRGLITEEGPTGMFLNPTSGSMPAGSLTTQYCLIVYEDTFESSVTAHQALASYGITDWLEFGVNFLLVDNDFDSTVVDGGPFLRARVIKDQGWWPEVSVGGILREGDSLFQRRTAFISASKAFGLFPKYLTAIRIHGGFRQVWEQRQFKAGGPAVNGQIVFVGGELELPKNIWMVAETSNKDNISPRVPYAVGVQVRHPDGFGFTAAAVQNGFAKQVGTYVGIGINF